MGQHMKASFDLPIMNSEGIVWRYIGIAYQIILLKGTAKYMPGNNRIIAVRIIVPVKRFVPAMGY